MDDTSPDYRTAPKHPNDGMGPGTVSGRGSEEWGVAIARRTRKQICGEGKKRIESLSTTGMGLAR